ncbi:Uridine-cytidine kinase C [Linum perenne]
MDDEVVQRVLQEGGRDFLKQSPSTSSSSSSILQSLPLHVSFDHGYYLLVKSIQELREKKGGVVIVGIGGPSGSGKSRNGVDDSNDVDSIDFDALVRNLEDLMQGKDTLIPLFDYQQKKRAGSKSIKSASAGVVIVDGTYALHTRLRSLLDIRVAVVGGVHFSLLSKVRYDIGDSCSLDYLIDSIFPLFRKHIEPDLHHAQIRINNSFVSSFREAIYKLKCRSEVVFITFTYFKSPTLSVLLIYLTTYCVGLSSGGSAYAFQGTETQMDHFIEMYLRPPAASEEARVNDWIKVRQSGIRYYLSLGDQRIVDKNFIIRPKAEFEVGRMTLGGLLALGYNVVVSYKRASTSVTNGLLSISLETIDTLNETFFVLRGTNRKAVGAEALKIGISGPWITKSYLEMILESKGVPRLNTPPLISATSTTSGEEGTIAAPKPIRTTPNLVSRLEDLPLPWTRSPTKAQMEPLVATWNFISSDPLHSGQSTVDFSLEATTDSSSFRDTMKLAPMPDSYDLDRGLLLAVQAIQALLENKGTPIIVGIGGPSGSGKTSLAHKMANIVGCEVVSLESYFISEQVKDFKYDDFNCLDVSLLLKNIDDVSNGRKTTVPIFDLETGARSGFKELEISEDCGVIIFEGVYALHPEIRNLLDLWIAVLKIRNDFDPVLSPESSLFVLKSNKQVSYQDIMKVLDPAKLFSSIQNFIDIYLKLPGISSNGMLTEGECIRVRICEGRFAVLIREPIREGNFIIQPKVDFDISISTVAGLLNLGYQAVAYIEASAFIYQDGKVLIEVDHLQDAPNTYLQIKGVDKEVVAAAGSTLKLDGSYTTKSYLQIVLENLPAEDQSSNGVHSHQASRLQELVEFIQTQGSSTSTASESSPCREPTVPIEVVIEEMQSRIKRLERWHIINTVLWTFLMSALVGYSLYQKKRQ